jgi:hypothetical protein
VYFICSAQQDDYFWAVLPNRGEIGPISIPWGSHGDHQAKGFHILLLAWVLYSYFDIWLNVSTTLCPWLIFITFCVMFLSCLSLFYVLYPILPVSLDCPFLLSPSFLSTAYLLETKVIHSCPSATIISLIHCFAYTLLQYCVSSIHRCRLFHLHMLFCKLVIHTYFVVGFRGR